MAFKLPKSKGDIFGINEELSEWGRPVFEKNLDENIVAEESCKSRKRTPRPDAARQATI
jgi:hypothetical protein